jgi:hypothetical protein
MDCFGLHLLSFGEQAVTEHVIARAFARSAGFSQHRFKRYKIAIKCELDNIH